MADVAVRTDDSYICRAMHALPFNAVYDDNQSKSSSTVMVRDQLLFAADRLQNKIEEEVLVPNFAAHDSIRAQSDFDDIQTDRMSRENTMYKPRTIDKDIFTFQNHTARGSWQDHHIANIKNNLDNDTLHIILDHKQKILSQWYHGDMKLSKGKLLQEFELEYSDPTASTVRPPRKEGGDVLIEAIVSFATGTSVTEHGGLQIQRQGTQQAGSQQTLEPQQAGSQQTPEPQQAGSQQTPEPQQSGSRAGQPETLEKYHNIMKPRYCKKKKKDNAVVLTPCVLLRLQRRSVKNGTYKA
ncbi:hypothetical protein SARC_03687 [Sphaeroforma arctica JP610]|uniref:Uncharacterized protein n=1 Tax=Sphaeroforma arctica JP610 TaxID=667725 RepID=A0A0L0G5B1_9EUKA|nr:hypothetical protein SARC_03687 [Sphaeroforma arctica JP610]KNC84094.1 hypothetical protein SARC_03687 [Sphaeroforma arctica JP610]|eukprot:XP_014157996.1 hypothetical protein SARC_03687 [Sphaeroforma arctica JP610]